MRYEPPTMAQPQSPEDVSACRDVLLRGTGWGDVAPPTGTSSSSPRQERVLAGFELTPPAHVECDERPLEAVSACVAGVEGVGVRVRTRAEASHRHTGAMGEERDRSNWSFTAALAGYGVRRARRPPRR